MMMMMMMMMITLNLNSSHAWTNGAWLGLLGTSILGLIGTTLGLMWRSLDEWGVAWTTGNDPWTNETKNLDVPIFGARQHQYNWPGKKIK